MVSIDKDINMWDCLWNIWIIVCMIIKALLVIQKFLKEYDFWHIEHQTKDNTI